MCSDVGPSVGIFFALGMVYISVVILTVITTCAIASSRERVTKTAFENANK